jgi:hypothetical protein
MDVPPIDRPSPLGLAGAPAPKGPGRFGDVLRREGRAEIPAAVLADLDRATDVVESLIARGLELDYAADGSATVRDRSGNALGALTPEQALDVAVGRLDPLEG